MSAVLEKNIYIYFVNWALTLKKKISIQSVQFNSELCPCLLNMEYRFKRERGAFRLKQVRVSKKNNRTSLLLLLDFVSKNAYNQITGLEKY